MSDAKTSCSNKMRWRDFIKHLKEGKCESCKRGLDRLFKDIENDKKSRRS